MLEKCPNTEFFLVRVLFTYQLICQQYLHNQNKKQYLIHSFQMHPFSTP